MRTLSRLSAGLSVGCLSRARQHAAARRSATNMQFYQ